MFLWVNCSNLLRTESAFPVGSVKKSDIKRAVIKKCIWLSPVSPLKYR